MKARSVVVLTSRVRKQSEWAACSRLCRCLCRAVAASSVMTVISVIISCALWFADKVAIVAFRQPEYIATVRASCSSSLVFLHRAPGSNESWSQPLASLNSRQIGLPLLLCANLAVGNALCTAFKPLPPRAQMVGTYCRWMIPGLLPFVFAMVIMKVRKLSVRMHIMHLHVARCWQNGRC